MKVVTWFAATAMLVIKKGREWLFRLIRCANRELNPFTKARPAKGWLGGIHLAFSVGLLWLVSGHFRQMAGIDTAVLAGVEYLGSWLRWGIETIVREEFPLVVDGMMTIAHWLLLVFGIFLIGIWILNTPNYAESTILSIISTYMGRVLTSVVGVALTVCLPVSVAILICTRDLATCLMIMVFIAVQQGYLRYEINTEMARFYLRRIAAIKSGVGQMGPEGTGETHDPADDGDPEQEDSDNDNEEDDAEAA